MFMNKKNTQYTQANVMTTNTSRNFEIWVEKKMQVKLKKKKLESRKRQHWLGVLSIDVFTS